MADATARADDLNQGMDMGDVINAMLEGFPHLAPAQLRNQWQHHIKKDPILTGRVTADPTSNARTAAVTELKQRRWFILVKRVREQLVADSPGTYHMKTHDGSTREVTYADVREHFVIGSDEENIRLDQNAKKLVGRRGKRGHMTNTGNSRMSATALRTGSAAGSKGPSVYILAKKTTSPHVTPGFLTKHGAPPGSICTAHKSGFMTDAQWEEIIEEFCKGLRRIDPVVEANPNWWIEYHIDGFSAKVNPARVQEVMRTYKILGVQSQGHTSHVNQSFDDAPGVASKREQRACLPHIRHNQRLSEPEQTLMCMLATEQALTSKVWIEGFTNVNLHPKNEMPIEVWLSKVSEHLVAAGEDRRYIANGLTMSDDEVVLNYNVGHLRAIETAVPHEYKDLNDEEKKTVLSAFRGDFDWDKADDIYRLVNEHEAVQKLGLLRGKTLKKWWKFVRAMDEGVHLGLLKPDDVMPTYTHVKSATRCLMK